MSERLVTREAQKAETQLMKFEKRKVVARNTCAATELAVDNERGVFVSELPEDVQRVLVAAGWVLE